ncbi:tail protein X [Brevibacillus brevis]|uniref:tail protein X n=1 Tax=Brevibacillus brevis TaxID=1393 RepID=UPI000D0E98F1|nr:tail protein X [Brevibacillus brevis]PSJ61934.1 phage tail protein [Brevibacillus brevis]RED19751.1 tail protein X [Brevibacillus brevis]VEF87269.1 Uncharacterised protein [Brevibacillus brevis]
MAGTYTTNAGDMWDWIAYKTMGSEYFMPQLIEANLKHRETVVFSSGIVLVVPDIGNVTTQDTSNLPPWKRE